MPVVTSDLERVMLHIFKAEDAHEGVDFDADEVGALSGYIAGLQSERDDALRHHAALEAIVRVGMPMLKQVADAHEAQRKMFASKSVGPCECDTCAALTAAKAAGAMT